MTQRLYHFTDDPNFEIDTEHHPNTRIGLPTGVPALYVTDDPHAWWSIWGRVQRRKYVAEIVTTDPNWTRYVRKETKEPDPEDIVIVFLVPGAEDVFQVERVLPVSEAKASWPAQRWHLPKGYIPSEWAYK